MKTVKLSEVAIIIAGQSPPSESYNQEGKGVPFFQGKADFNEKFPTVRYWCNSPLKLSLPNDILFSLRAPVGPTNLNNVKACIGRGIAAIRCKETVELNFLLHFLRANEDKIASLGTGSTFKAITIGVLKDLPIPLPPLSEQKRIADLLDAADTLRKKDKALLEKYDQLAQSLFLDMFGDPVKNEKGWEVRELGEFINMKAGKSVQASDISTEFKIDLFPCYGGNGLRGYVNSYTHEGNHVLIGRQGALCGNVKIATGKFHATEHAIVCSEKTKFNTTWLFYLLSMLNLNKYASGAAQPGLNVGTLQILNVIFAPISLQNQFAEQVKLIEKQKEIVKKNLEKSEELMKGLMGEVFK